MPVPTRCMTAAHLLTLLCGLSLCVAGSEGTGVLLLCFSVVFLIALRVDALDVCSIAPSLSPATPEFRMSTAERAVEMMTRRYLIAAALLKSFETEVEHERADFNTRISWVFEHMDFDDACVDIALHALRSDVLRWQHDAQLRAN